MYPEHIIERFWSRVDKTDECWNWTAGKIRRGYGMIRINEKLAVLAHRMSYEIHRGEIPEGMLICHTCDNPSCVNPAHLFVGTHYDNAQDKVKKGRGKFPNPRYGEDHHEKKLTWKDVDEIRAFYQKGVRGKGLSATAKKYNVSQTIIAKIVHGKVWIR